MDDEPERRLPRRGSLGLQEILEAFGKDPEHMTGEPASEQDLLRIEGELGRGLPAPFRAFLARFGGGLFFHGHEIFGPRRLMVHDIELVPDILSVRRWLASRRELREGAIPFHRVRGVIHVLEEEQVSSVDGAGRYPDFTSFLETVVLPRSPRSGA